MEHANRLSVPQRGRASRVHDWSDREQPPRYSLFGGGSISQDDRPVDGGARFPSPASVCGASRTRRAIRGSFRRTAGGPVAGATVLRAHVPLRVLGFGSKTTTSGSSGSSMGSHRARHALAPLLHRARRGGVGTERIEPRIRQAGCQGQVRRDDFVPERITGAVSQDRDRRGRPLSAGIGRAFSWPEESPDSRGKKTSISAPRRDSGFSPRPRPSATIVTASLPFSPRGSGPSAVRVRLCRGTRRRPVQLGGTRLRLRPARGDGRLPAHQAPGRDPARRGGMDQESASRSGVRSRTRPGPRAFRSHAFTGDRRSSLPRSIG